MAKLFIVDHSLRSTGEHHFDFTTCLVEAGKEMGFEVVVGANRGFKPPASLSRMCEVNPVFRQSAYDSPSYLAGMERMQRREGHWPIEPSRGKWLAWFGTRWRQKAFMRRRTRFEHGFLSDCERFFAGVHFSEDDHVLFAAVSELEVMASAQFLARSPRTLPGNWHWLFHFPVFEPPPTTCGRQLSRQRELHRYLQAACNLLPYHQVHFFATTEGLAEQYSRLKFAEVSTIPYPISTRFAPEFENPQGQAPELVKLVCPGAVRREKGQRNFVREVVASIGSVDLSPNKIQLALQVAKSKQAKWIVGFGAKSVANATLDAASPHSASDGSPPIVLWDHPLPPDQYARLIRETDCGLLMYDSRDYLVRRAGILGELLSKGRPVIVSAANWLSEQLKEAHFQYASRLSEGPFARHHFQLADGQWARENVPLPGGVISFDQARHPFQIEFPRDTSDGGFVLQFQWQGQPEYSDYVRIEVLDGDARPVDSQVIGRPENSEQASVFFRLDHHSPTIRLRFRNALSDSMLGLKRVSMVVLDQNSRDLPLGVVGLVAADQSQLPRLIREMVTHYGHYRRTARQLAPRWFAAHRPTATLASLLASAENCRKAA